MNSYKVKAPAPPRSRLRGPLALILTLLLPPVGLIVLWRGGVYRTRGRALITLAATLEMALLIVLLTPRPGVQPSLPIPATSVRYTQAPDSDVLASLSQMDQLLRAEQESAAQAQATVAPILQEEQLARQQDVLNTIVYSVYHNAKYYHAQRDCNGQINNRELTVQEATRKGLGPCPDCHPPVFQPLLSLDDAAQTAAPDDLTGVEAAGSDATPSPESSENDDLSIWLGN